MWLGSPSAPLSRTRKFVVKLSATDVLAPTTMKNAAKCDTSCDLQNPVNHRNFERTSRSRDMPGGMLVGEEEARNRPLARGRLEALARTLRVPGDRCFPPSSPKPGEQLARELRRQKRNSSCFIFAALGRAVVDGSPDGGARTRRIAW